MLELKALEFILPFFLTFSNSGGIQPFHHQYRQQSKAVHLNTFAQLNSSNLHTSFYYNFLNGGFVDAASKDAMRNMAWNQNRAGLDWNTELCFVNANDSLFSSRGWGYYIGFKNRIIGEGGFSSDAFELAFYGNAGQAGNIMELRNTRFNLTAYQQLQVGFFKTIQGKKFRHSFGFGVGYVNGNFNYQLNAPQATLFTETDGSFIEVAANATFNQTDAQNSSFFFPNGSGVSADVFYEFSTPKGHVWSFKANDLGFINWNDRSQTTQIDSVFRFEGVNIRDVFDVDGAYFEEYLDSLRDQYIITDTAVRYNTILPMQFSLSYTHCFISQKLYLHSGVQARISPNYFPYIFSNLVYYPKKWLMVGGGLGYGGYGSWNVQFDIGFNFNKGWLLSLHTRNLEGIIPNRAATGLSAGLKFSKLF